MKKMKNKQTINREENTSYVLFFSKDNKTLCWRPNPIF